MTRHLESRKGKKYDSRTKDGMVSWVVTSPGCLSSSVIWGCAAGGVERYFLRSLHWPPLNMGFIYAATHSICSLRSQNDLSISLI